MKVAYLPLALTLLLATAPVSFGQVSELEVASNEAVRVQANQIVLRTKLQAAAAAQQRHDLPTAAKLYDEAWELVQKIGPLNVQIETEQGLARAGLVSVRLELARGAASRDDFKDVATQVDDALRVEPSNALALAAKRDNDKRLLEQRGKIPSDEAKSLVPAIEAEKISAGTLVQDGKLLFEMGKLDEAEKKLLAAKKIDPQYQPAYYYLNLIAESRSKEALASRELDSRNRLVEISKAWETPAKRDSLPVPNAYARTNLIHTSKGRQSIYSKLERIRLDEVKYDGLPLSEVVINLNDQAKRRDPEKRGLNFIINPNIDPVSSGAVAAPGAVDPTTGLPVAGASAPAEQVDMSQILIKINPPLTDVRLFDVLDAIVKVADKPIKYSIEDYAIVFSLKGHEPSPLYVRFIKVDPNTFVQGLEAVFSISFGDISTSGGGGGGGGGGGSSGSSGGISGALVPRVAIATSGGGGNSSFGSSGGGSSGSAFGAGVGVVGGGGGGGSQGGVGIHAVTRTYDLSSVQALVRSFFMTMGIDLNPPKSIFFNDREGTLVVRANLQDLDVIETAVQVLNITPPQVNIKTKFVEVSQNDTKALGFDWYLGNVLMNNGAMGLSGGTAPSYNGSPTMANPAGSFPGSAAAGTAIAPSGSDSLLTGGLRNMVNAPAVTTFSGILTDPQFRVVVRALEQRDGTDMLNESSVTTLSGRQTEIQVVDLITIVTGTSLNQTSGGSGAVGSSGSSGGNGSVASAGVIGSTINYPTTILPFGPTLDVVPYVSADGFTIQMTIIPTITEFLGYDDPGAFVPQAQSAASGQSGVAIPIRAQLPLPHFRVRQVTTSAIVWDGQTVVLGGLITENVVKLKDKVPVLGDLPWVGRFFRSESNSSQKKNLMIFLTPTIIDPAGNRLHSEDEMPFAQNSIPDKKAGSVSAQ